MPPLNLFKNRDRGVEEEEVSSSSSELGVVILSNIVRVLRGDANITLRPDDFLALGVVVALPPEVEDAAASQWRYDDVERRRIDKRRR